jgi:hypothetical protein
MIYLLSFNLGIPSVTAYNKNGVKIDFNFQKVDNNLANILDIALIVSNALAVPVTDFVFQAAVPKVGHIDILGANSWKYVLDYALTSFACKKSTSSSTLPNTACAMRDFFCLAL